MSTRNARLHLTLIMGLLVLLHFYVRPRFGPARLSPDLLLFALVTFAMRSGPGAGAVAGFLIGLINDALAPARFGASTLAHTVVGYAAAWGRAVFFADNLLVTAAFVAVGLWLRDLILLVDVYHEFSHPYEMTEAMVKALKPGGRLVFVEFRLEDPKVPIKLVHKMTERQVLKEMSVHPLRHVETVATLPWQHIVIFEKKKAD